MPLSSRHFRNPRKRSVDAAAYSLPGPPRKAIFSWSEDGEHFHVIRPACDAGKLSDEYAGQGFTGAFVGMFCVDTEFYKKPADFEYFDYQGGIAR